MSTILILPNAPPSGKERRLPRLLSSLAAGVLAVSLLGGCSLLRKPDLSRRSGIADLRKPDRPLILIHGFLGSKLRDPKTGKVAWGNMASILTGGDEDLLALPVADPRGTAPSEALEAFQIYDSLWGVQYYSKILRSLKTAGGYTIGDIDNPKPGENAFVFVYDWRRDNVDSARRLAEAIDRLKRALGDPDLKFDLLAHSQGGLIARYYVEYGGVDVLGSETTPTPTMAGAANVHKLIMLGTPNRGCLGSLKALHLGIGKVFWPMRPEVVFTMPAVYQMLPPRGALVFSDIDGTPIRLDLYDADIWMREGWSVFSPKVQLSLRRKRDAGEATMGDLNLRMRDFLQSQLIRADRFHRALDAPVPVDRAPAARGVAYYAFGSDCVSTLKTAIIHKGQLLFDGGRFRGEPLAQQVAQILYGPGDGMVLMQSLLDLAEPAGPGDQPSARETSTPVDFDSAFFVCENHGLLPGNPIFQNNLFYVLLWQGQGQAQPGH